MTCDHSWTKAISAIGTRRVHPIVAAALIVTCVPICPLAARGDGHVPVPTSQPIPISVDRRVELIGIVFRLAGNPEYKQCRIRSYATDIERHFCDFDRHPVVEMATRLRNTRRMSCDGPMSLAVHIDRELRPLKSFDQWPWGLDGR